MNKIELNRLTQVNNNEQNFLAALNDNLKRIQEAINDTLSRTGVVPNQMEQVLDMNGERIINVGPAVNPTDVVTKQDIQDIIDAAEAAIARLDGLVEAAKIAIQTYVTENVYPVINEAVGAAQAAQTAAEAARDALLLDPDYQAIVTNLPTIMGLVDNIDVLETIKDNMNQLLAVADGIDNINAVAADLTRLDSIADNLEEILKASTYATQAATSASNAAASATAAQGHASTASTAASNASASATAAAGSATSASTAASTAANKASEAATSASSAAASATQADAAVTAASASAIQAAGHATNALVWAEGDDEAVEALGGEHSSKRWAEIAGQTVGGLIEVTGDSGTLTAEQMALIGPGVKIINDGEVFTMSNNDSSLVYTTFINGDVSASDMMAFKAIYVNTSDGTWTKEDVTTGGGGSASYDPATQEITLG